MRLFSRDSIPELRKWTNKYAEKAIKGSNERDANSLLLALAVSLLLGISSIFVVEQKQAKAGSAGDTEKVFDKAAKSFDTDWCLFEILCYLLFRLDVWLFSNGKKAFREKFFSTKVCQNCLSVFSTIFKSDTVFPAFNNRCNVYGALLRNHEGAERELFYLTQFMYRSEGEKKLEVYDVHKNFHIIIGDAFDEMTLQTRVAGYVHEMFPIHIDHIKDVMKRLSDSGQLVE
jgi:hypothetical protein